MIRTTYTRTIGNILYRFRYKTRDIKALLKLDIILSDLEDFYRELKYQYDHGMDCKEKITEIRRAIHKVKKQHLYRLNLAKIHGSFVCIVGLVDSEGRITLNHSKGE
jgi:hypothetical protein